MTEILENPSDVESDKIALMDLEGTLTPGNRKIPENPSSEHMKKLLKGENIEGEQKVGYWSGLNLLAGEKPENYFDRVDKWKNGDIDFNNFEDENVKLWNNYLSNSDFERAEELIQWYNEEFLNLRRLSSDLVEILQEQGYETGIISHTSVSLSKLAAENLDVDYVVPSWRFNKEDEKFSRTTMNKYAVDKSEIVEELREVNVDEIVFYGNAKNDIKIANKADRSYLVENKENVDYVSADAFIGEFDEIFIQTQFDLGVRE